MGERRTLVGARIASGGVVAVIAGVVVAAVALLPIPDLAAAPRSVPVDPAPAAQLRVCPGAAMRIGDATGGSAGTAFAIGAPSIAGEVHGGALDDGALERIRLTSADPTASPGTAPELLRVPAGDTPGSLVAGAQAQAIDAPDFRGFAAASCAEPSGSVWLVGGATTVGRSTVVLLANPTDVPARVSLEIFGEGGRVSAPGLSGIDVPPGGQHVLSLAGFAPGLQSPVVHVTARGGRVVAALQHSVVRGLAAAGVEAPGAGADPAEHQVIPGVRIVDGVGTSRASALADWQDVVPVVRIAVPGETDGTATVRVVPEGDAVGTSFLVQLEAGTVAELPLDPGAHAEGEGAGDEGVEAPAGLADGTYTVFVDADVPVVAGVRASTAVDTGVDATQPDAVFSAPPSDLAWFSAAPELDRSTLVVVPVGPSPVMSIANPTDGPVEFELASARGAEVPRMVTVPAGGSASVPVAPGAYLLSGTEDLAVLVSFADAGTLAAFVVSPPRPVAGPVVVRPD